MGAKEDTKGGGDYAKIAEEQRGKEDLGSAIVVIQIKYWEGIEGGLSLKLFGGLWEKGTG
jgi:hypothetical protein